MSFHIINGVLERYFGDDSEVTIPEGVLAIGEAVFQHCGI